MANGPHLISIEKVLFGADQVVYGGHILSGHTDLVVTRVQYHLARLRTKRLDVRFIQLHGKPKRTIYELNKRKKKLNKTTIVRGIYYN